MNAHLCFNAVMLVEEPVIICLTLWQTTVLGIVYLFFEAVSVAPLNLFESSWGRE